MKKIIQRFLQKILGFKNYLVIFSFFKIFTLKLDKKERDFFSFLDMVKNSDNVLDIGANVGIMTYHLSKKIKAGKLFSFEPIPENFNALQRIVALSNLKNVTLFNCALSDKKTVLTMQMPIEKGVKMQGLSKVIDEVKESENIFSVDAFRLDDIDKIKNIKIDAIKIDVENFEFAVLQGATKTIEKSKPIIYIELWDNDNRISCFNWAKQLNYEIKIVENNSLVSYNSQINNTQNFFFLPKN